MLMARFNDVFGNVPTTRFSHWVRRALVVSFPLAVIFLVVFGSLAAARAGNVIGSIALVMVGVAFVPLFAIVAGSEQRRVTRSWNAARDGGAVPVYVFTRGWRTEDGREQSLSSGWIGVKDHHVIIVAGTGGSASRLILTLDEFFHAQRRAVLGGAAYPQLEVKTEDLTLRFELVSDRRPLFSFLGEEDVDEAARAISVAATQG